MPIAIRHARSVPASADLRIRLVTCEALEGDDLDGVPRSQLECSGFEAGRAQTLLVPDPAGRPTLLVGLGPRHEVTPAVLRGAAGTASRSGGRSAAAAIELPEDLPEGISTADAVAALAEGISLGAYRFDAYKSAPRPARLALVAIVAGGRGVAGAIERARQVAEAVRWARDLVNHPGGVMTPREVVKAARSMGRRAGVKVTVMDEAAIRSAGLGGLLGVSRGSEQPPRFLRLSYVPSGTPRTVVALVGKGITFDSGGLSIKTADGMTTMKSDMGGAAAVLGAISAVASLGTPVEVRGYVPLTDNMTGGDAMRPGDVVTIRGGRTVEVLNTDAEGRLVLADALVTAAGERPDVVVDVATLTGACMVALGPRVAGLMGRGDELLDAVEAAASRSGEQVWRLPLPQDLRPQLDSKVADLRNVGTGRHGGALVAGLFLQEFVPTEIPWAHLDIAGPAWSDDDHDEVVSGGTGFGVRLLVELLEELGRRGPAAESVGGTSAVDP